MTMTSVFATIAERTFDAELIVPAELQPQRYSVEANGGPDQAEVIAIGDELAIWGLVSWLRGPLTIKHPEVGEVWWGYIHEIEITVGEITVGISLDAMFNRVQVVYNEPALYGSSSRLQTAWQQDDESVATYGTKELRLTIGDITTAVAEARAITEALRRGRPQPSLPSFGGSSTIQATLRGKGWESTLGWKYYSQAAGLEGHFVSGSAVHKLGLGIVDTTIGFSASRKAIHDMTGRLQNFKKGDRVRVSGSASNNNTYTIDQGTNRTAASLTAATISFAVASGQQRIQDSANGLTPFDAGDMILVSGAGANNGYYRVLSGASNGAWVQVDRTITPAAAGASITIIRGNHITVLETIVDEYAGSSVTLQIEGEMLRQTFSTAVGGWTVGALAARMRKIGSPADGVRMSLYSNSAGNPNTQLDTGVLAAASVPSSMNWATTEITNTVALTAATTYHVVIERTGSLSPTDYYEVSLDEDLGYASGDLRLKINGAWNTANVRTPDADLCFRVIGYKETTAQIADIVEACGQFFIDTDIITPSGIDQPMYRDGTRTALKEIEDLLAAGTSDGRRLLASVTPQRILRIAAEAPSTDDHYRLGRDGRLRGALDQSIPDGVPTVAVWADVDVIPATVRQGMIASAGIQFIERCTIEAATGRVQYGFRNQADTYDLGGIRDG